MKRHDLESDFRMEAGEDESWRVCVCVCVCVCRLQGKRNVTEVIDIFSRRKGPEIKVLCALNKAGN